jgi:hypothetical protein
MSSCESDPGSAALVRQLREYAEEAKILFPGSVVSAKALELAELLEKPEAPETDPLLRWKKLVDEIVESTVEIHGLTAGHGGFIDLANFTPGDKEIRVDCRLNLADVTALKALLELPSMHYEKIEDFDFKRFEALRGRLPAKAACGTCTAWRSVVEAAKALDRVYTPWEKLGLPGLAMMEALLRLQEAEKLRAISGAGKDQDLHDLP